MHTCVEGWHFAVIARPKVVGLVLCMLGRASVLFVGVVLIHPDDTSLRASVNVYNVLDFYERWGRELNADRMFGN